MELTHRSTHQQIIHRVTVTGGPVLPMPYSQAGKTYRVEHLSVTYTQRGGSWTAQTVQLSGTVLKKDGSDSKTFTRHDAWGWEQRSELGFVRAIVDGFRPVGSVELPSISEA